jgi:rare lipoprotein A
MKKFLMLMLLMCSGYSLTAPTTVNQQEPAGVVTETLQEVRTGTISWYGRSSHGRKMANGALFDMYKFTCAHPYFPFGTMLLIKEATTGNSVIVEVTDRGPFVKSRILDLSYSAAKALDIITAGTAKVTVFLITKP